MWATVLGNCVYGTRGVVVRGWTNKSRYKIFVFQRLIKYNGLKAISDSLLRDSYSIKKCGITDLRHFLYKSKSTAQYTSPELEAPYLTAEQQERLFGLYHFLHHRIHSSSRPLKILYHVGQYETLLGWVRLCNSFKFTCSGYTRQAST